MKHVLDWGSMLMMSIWGIMLFCLGTNMGMSDEVLVVVSMFIYLVYLFAQGIIYLNYPVGEKTAFLKDLGLSIIPGGVWLISVFCIIVNHGGIRPIFLSLFIAYLLTFLMDVLIYTSAGSRLMIFTDKNAASSNSS